MRRRQLKKLWARLTELQRMAPTRDTLLLKLGAAKSQYPAAWRLVEVEVAKDGVLAFCLRKKNCANSAVAKAATSCAPTSAQMTRPRSGNSTCC